jgi:hypothetical protein
LIPDLAPIPREAIFAARRGCFLGPIEPYPRNNTVSEIMINGFDEAYVEHRGCLDALSEPRRLALGSPQRRAVCGPGDRRRPTRSCRSTSRRLRWRRPFLRLTEDGSRNDVRITEARGLDSANNVRLHDLFVSRLKGRTPQGRLIADLQSIGAKPTFAGEVSEHGQEGMVSQTAGFWTGVSPRPEAPLTHENPYRRASLTRLRGLTVRYHR